MIGVCLKYMANNYGSKLQALATVKAIEDLGLEYELINYRKKGLMHKIKAIPRLFNPVFIDGIIVQRQLARARREIPGVAKRYTLFKEYDAAQFLSKTVNVDYYSDLRERAKKYQVVLTCSDQLWSPSGLGTNFYNLMFVPDEVRKVSWSSSFGVSQIPWYQRKATRKYLNRIEHVSVRENSGAAIVKELTGRDVPVLMDPVFVYTKAEWSKMIPEEKVYDFPYILSYILGENVEYRKRTEEFAKKHGIKIVAITFSNTFVEYDKTYGDVQAFDVTPEKFLNLVRCASYVCTDSFHGAAFSVIMEKKFAIFNRYSENSMASKNTRIDNLCQNLSLEGRRAGVNTNLDTVLLADIDFVQVKNRLQVYIDNTKAYLRKAFEGVK